jgi:hypothetical protein
MARTGGRGNRGREGLLFLKKKKQKDFSFIAPGLGSLARGKWKESFLVLFFKKEHAFFL